MKLRIKPRFEDLPRDYSGLCGVLLPRPIRDDVDYSNVTEVTDAMALWSEKFTVDQGDYFDLLCTLIEDYDSARVKWPVTTGLDALKHLMAEHGLTGAGLSRLLGGSRNLGAMILRGERNLTLEHVRTLAAHFNVSPELFI